MKNPAQDVSIMLRERWRWRSKQAMLIKDQINNKKGGLESHNMETGPDQDVASDDTLG